MTAHNNPKYLLFHNTKNQELTVRSDDTQSQEYCTFSYPPDLPPNAWFTQSNGLVCLSTMFDYVYQYNPAIYLWNPLVQKFKTVPDTPLPRFKVNQTWWNALAFGFLPEVNDYVVVHMIKLRSNPALNLTRDTYKQYPHTVMIGVYSLNTNSWKKICQDKVFVDRVTSKESGFVNGRAFWVGRNDNGLHQLVMFFDTKTNVLRQIEVPYWGGFYSPLFLPFRQAIACFVVGDAVFENYEDLEEDDESYSPHLNIWVIKGGMTDELSWEKKISATLGENVGTQILGTRNNETLVLLDNN
ncbi:hypothetical protein POM88_037882 [Heracleum sosnowskyi]|uniref:F-box associated beta-propeller type 3 domain-containing protein n=1 Tax=Heracleum sosnowskyi TaxID=360622 RepID=A0AAD8MDP1_9APIA|nr:hypothetical protein POM88_037882 [Heracleum sosnowskyi]